MDIVGSLCAELKLKEDAATGLAGGLLLLVEEIVLTQVSPAAAATIRAGVPELRDWQTSAPTIVPGMLTLDALRSNHGPSVDGDFSAVLSRFEVDAGAAPLAASLLLQFLSSRLEPSALSVVVGAVPVLTRQ